MATWKKSSAALIEAFDAALPEDERVVRRQMFGYPAAFTAGNMFCGLFEESVLLRLGEARSAELIETDKAKPFAPMGKAMRGYAALSGADAKNEKLLRSLIAESFAFAITLEPKAPKPKKKMSQTKKTKR